MALLFAGHTATIYATIETPDPTTKIVPVPTEDDGVTVSCQISPVRNEVLVDPVTGVELRNPYRLKLEPEDVESAPYGARVVWQDTGYEFRITKKGNLHDGGEDFADLAYGVAEMEQLEVVEDGD